MTGDAVAVAAPRRLRAAALFSPRQPLTRSLKPVLEVVFLAVRSRAAVNKLLSVRFSRGSSRLRRAPSYARNGRVRCPFCFVLWRSDELTGDVSVGRHWTDPAVLI